jgi:hypothetical protein
MSRPLRSFRLGHRARSAMLDATRSELQVFCFSGRVDAGAKCDFANVDTPPAIALIKKCVFNGVFFAAKASTK